MNKLLCRGQPAPCMLPFFVLFAVLSAFSSGALTVHVAPLSSIDETGSREVHTGNAHRELLQKLNGIEAGTMLRFASAGSSAAGAPQSQTDAARLSRAENAEYLLYGYIAKNDYTFTAEIKLFDYGNRRVDRIFYAMDDHGNYERLLNDLAYKIVSCFSDAFHLELFETKPEYMSLSVPASIGYWTPLGGRWTDILTGTFLIEGGLWFIPADDVFTLFGIGFHLSIGAHLSYRFGVGNPDNYKAYDHSLTISAPIRLHIRLNRQSNVFLGGGLQYSIDFLRIQEKYSQPETKVYDSMGIMASLGYQHTLTDSISLYLDNIFELKFYRTPMPSYSVRTGIVYMLFTKELVQKW
ncbi:hypothetical protein LJC14_00490 [Treponema sp. OttesenSCG-928-L16]|nr:hypothetical protein [Treponema sp. OttesenSCG-928-L16]